MPLDQSLYFRRALELCRSRLGDPVIGFNPQHAHTLAINPLYSKVTPIIIDVSDNSPGLILGKAKLETLVKGTNKHSWPLINMWSDPVGGSNSGQVPKNMTFAGIISVVMDVHITFPTSDLPHDLESPSDSVTDTMFNIFNNPSATYQNPMRPGIVQSLGNLSMIGKSEVVVGAKNWVQILGYRIEFGARYS